MPSRPDVELPGSVTGADAPDWRNLLTERGRRSRKISWLLDECIRIPGTRLRFGLDPILGLFPYGGEAVSTIMGTLILSDAGKKGLPLATLLRMGGNMIINALVGVIPGVGDLFSFWFKSNSRNHALLNAFLESEHGTEARGGWWPVILVLAIIGTVVVINVLTWVLLLGFVAGAFRELAA